MRKAVFTESFYPEQADALSDQIEFFLQKSLVSTPKSIVRGGICPHAGYVYSGRTAAYLMNSLTQIEDMTVVIIGPSHQFSFYGASVYDDDAYETPLGLVEINQEISKAVRDENPSVSFIPQAHVQEHSIEVLLPFLQKRLTQFDIVPIIIGSYDQLLIDQLVSALEKHCDKDKTLVLASSDFSHFFEAQLAERMDAEAVDHICHWDIDSLVKRSEDLAIQMCGLAPILVTMTLLQKWGIKTVDHLFYEHSGQINGDLSSVVGYNAIRFY